MNDFNFKIPQDIIFGKGSLSRLPEVLKEANCKKVLLVSDHGLEAVGVVAKVEKIITEAGAVPRPAAQSYDRQRERCPRSLQEQRC